MIYRYDPRVTKPLHMTDAERSALVAVLNRLCVQMTADERQALIGLLERTDATA